MDLVADFVRETGALGVGEGFRRWGGMLLTSCLLGRNVSTSIMAGEQLYPNIYVMLVAPSGYGKSRTIKAVRAVLRPYTNPAQVGVVPQVALCSIEISASFLLHALGKAFPDPKGKKERSRCFAALADEIGAFFQNEITRYQIANLCSVWDCEDMLYSRGTVTGQREGDQPEAWQPYMTAVWGATPAWLTASMPRIVFELGFPARVMFVLGEQRVRRAITRGDSEDFYADLRERLYPLTQEVSKAKGFFAWADDAWAAFEAWVEADCPRRDGSTDWLGHTDAYNQRRLQHLAKMALILACARHPRGNLITLDDFTDAREMLWDVEEGLPKFQGVVGSNPDVAGEMEVLDWVRSQGEVQEGEVRNRLRMRARNTGFVRAQVNELIASGQLIVVDETVSEPLRRFRAAAV